MESRLQQNNIREVWRGLKTISGQNKVSGRGFVSGDCDRANELNLFFNRFDSTPSPPNSNQTSDLSVSQPFPLWPLRINSSPLRASETSASPTSQLTIDFSVMDASHPSPHPSLQGASIPPSSSLSLTVNQVRKELKKIKARKAPGPDGICPRMLKDCADQLSEVILYIFNLSLSLERVPVLWKTSCVVPVPKTAHPREPNHFRPVALTSHLMKTLERIVLRHLRTVVSSELDPLQFAYQPGIGVEDAIIYLSHRALSHLESTGSTVRVMFFLFFQCFQYNSTIAALEEAIGGWC